MIPANYYIIIEIRKGAKLSSLNMKLVEDSYTIGTWVYGDLMSASATGECSNGDDPLNLPAQY